MTPVIIKSSRLKYAVLLFIAVAFVAIGVLLLVLGKPRRAWVDWGSILFFGASVPFFVSQLFDSRPRLVLDDHGVLDRTLGVGVIPWSEITGAQLVSVQGNHFISLEVQNPNSWLKRLSPMKRAMAPVNKALGFSVLNLNLSAIAADPVQVYELILKKSVESKMLDG